MVDTLYNAASSGADSSASALARAIIHRYQHDALEQSTHPRNHQKNNYTKRQDAQPPKHDLVDMGLAHRGDPV
jgi:hypothetical protein